MPDHPALRNEIPPPAIPLKDSKPAPHRVLGDPEHILEQGMAPGEDVKGALLTDLARQPTEYGQASGTWALTRPSESEGKDLPAPRDSGVRSLDDGSV